MAEPVAHVRGAVPAAPVRKVLNDGGVMRVVFSERLKQVLSDPKAAEQLREFVASMWLGEPSDITITLKDANGKTVHYVPTIVPMYGPRT